MFSWKTLVSQNAECRLPCMIRYSMNFIKFYSVVSGIQRPKVQFVVALFEECTELLPFVSILHLIATTYPSI